MTHDGGRRTELWMEVSTAPYNKVPLGKPHSCQKEPAGFSVLVWKFIHERQVSILIMIRRFLLLNVFVITTYFSTF